MKVFRLCDFEEDRFKNIKYTTLDIKKIENIEMVSLAETICQCDKENTTTFTKSRTAKTTIQNRFDFFNESSLDYSENRKLF